MLRIFLMPNYSIVRNPSFKSLPYEWHELSWWWETNIQSLIAADVPTRNSATFERHYKNRGSNFLLAFGEKKVLFGESRSPFEEHAEIFTDMQFGGRFSESAEESSFWSRKIVFESDDTFSNRIHIHWLRHKQKMLKALICGYVWTINTLLNCLQLSYANAFTPQQVNKVHIFTAQKMLNSH